jgi:septal ring factor EnvC (AmiA/AmiB activator)
MSAFASGSHAVNGFRFVAPPGWPLPEPGWVPPADWQPHPSWPPAPPGWKFWVADTSTGAGKHTAAEPSVVDDLAATAAPTPDVGDTQPDLDLQAERRAAAQRELEAVREQIEQARREVVELNDSILLQQVGIYEYHHPLENAEQYKEALAAIRQEVRDFIKNGTAILASDRFAYNNSLAQGR